MVASGRIHHSSTGAQGGAHAYVCIWLGVDQDQLSGRDIPLHRSASSGTRFC
jgi:hypothetical protein